MTNTNDLLNKVSEIQWLEQQIEIGTPQVPVQILCDLSGNRLSLAAQLIEQAAVELTDVFSPTQTSELKIIAGRIDRIRERRTAAFALENADPKASV